MSLLQTGKPAAKSRSTQRSSSSWCEWNTAYNSWFAREGSDLHSSRTFCSVAAHVIILYCRCVMCIVMLAKP